LLDAEEDMTYFVDFLYISLARLGILLRDLFS